MRSKNQTFIEEARRKQLVGCAIDVIAEEGLVRASMARIARRAEVSTGVISYHFGSKDDLIKQVVEVVAGTAVELMVPRILRQGNAAGMLRELIVSNLDFMRTHRNMLLALVEILIHDPRADDGPGVYARQNGQAVQDVEKVLRHGQATGEFRDFPTRPMALAVRGAIDAVANDLVVHPDLDLPGYAAEMADAFDRATRAPRHPTDR